MVQAKTSTKGEQTRAAIVKAAHELFLKNGFHGTSMRQIADRCELAVGGIYNHFANKEDIFAAVLDAYHPYHTVLPALNETQGETIDAFVRDAADRFREGIAAAEKNLLPLIFIELVEFQGQHLKSLAKKLLPAMLAFVQRFGERRGRLRPIPLPVMLRTFMGLFIGYLMSELIIKGLPLLKNADYDWFGGMVDIYLHGIVEAEG